MTTTRSILSVLFLSSFASLFSGCAASAADDDVAQDDAELRRGWVDGDCTKGVDVPINAETLTVDEYGTVFFMWQGMATYSRLPGVPRPYWEIPERDGDRCDATCATDVIARAAAHGGKLHGTVRVSRFSEVRQERDGSCHLYHRENLVLDLRTATKGLRPDWEGYDFLELEADGEVDTGAAACPAHP